MPIAALAGSFLFVRRLIPSLCLGASALAGALPPSCAAEGPRPRAVPPRHDPDDQLFRYAPMEEASRSLVLQLATNVHLAFDTELLRSHTVWQGASLNLYGTPYT